MSEATLWTSLLSLLGVVIGLVGGLAVSLALEAFKRRADRISLSQAIVGEISALVEIVRRRHYIEDLTALIEKKSSREKVIWPLSLGSASLPVAILSPFTTPTLPVSVCSAIHCLGASFSSMHKLPRSLRTSRTWTMASLSPWSERGDPPAGKASDLFKDTDNLGRSLTGQPLRS